MEYIDTNITQLFNLMNEIPNRDIIYKNTKGNILWHNNYSVHDLKLSQNDIRGKTISDIFSRESAKLCTNDELEVINSKNTICKQQSLTLITGEQQEYFTTLIPWMVAPGQVGGIIVNAINIKQTLDQTLKTCYINDQQNDVLNPQLQNLYFNFIQPIKEILLLSNLIMLGDINNDLKSLCLDITKFAKILLSDCNDTLTSKKIIDTKQVSIIFEQINLRELLQKIFTKHMNTIKPKNTKLFLTISNQIPKIVISDLSRINKVLQIVVKSLLESALIFSKNNIELFIYSKVELLNKVNNKNIIISIIFETENYLLQKIIYNEQQMQNNFKLNSTLNKENDSNYGLTLATILIKELNGNIELIDNKINSKIIIHLPVEI